MIRLYIQDLLELGVKKPIDKHANLVLAISPSSHIVTSMFLDFQ
jgi:hypothetical protein